MQKGKSQQLLAETQTTEPSWAEPLASWPHWRVHTSPEKKRKKPKKKETRKP